MRTAVLFFLAVLAVVAVQGCVNPRNEPGKAASDEKRGTHGDNNMAPGAG